MATITYAFEPIAGETTLNQNTAGAQVLPASAELGGGDFITVWDNAGQISGRIFDNTGAPRTAEFTVNTTSTATQTDPEVAALTGGGAVAVWTDQSLGAGNFEIRAQMINPNGTLFGPEIFISEQPGPATTAGDQTRADVIGLSDGGWVVVWQDDDGATHDVLAQIYNADGSFRPAAGTADGRIRIDPGAIDVTQPTVAPITGGFALVWSQQAGVGDLDMFGQRFNLAGGLVGTSFLVDSGGTVSSQSDAVGLPTGGFALAYLDNNFGELDITLSTWDASANLLDFVTANGPGGFVGGGDGNQTDPSIDVLSNGFIQVSWTNDFGADLLDSVDTAVWSGPAPLSLILDAPGVALSSQNQSALAGLPLGKFSLAGHDTGGSSDITGVIQELVRTTTGDNTAEILSGDSLRDIMFGRGGDDFLFGGENNDSLFGEAGIDTLVGGPGDDRLEGGADRDRLEGGDGNDGLLGDDGDDQIVGEAGNDQMIGGAGLDLMLGGTGDDRLEGNDGNDRLEGGDGFDTLVGDEGIDLLLGGAGNDQMFGGDGGDRLEGAGGIDALAGGEGDDQMTGGTEGDFLFGGNGLDQLLGDEGADLLSGEGGGDRLQGGDGADQMYGGDGDDIMIGDAGNDDMNGQFGNDLFFFSGAFGNDTIFGFGAGAGTEDKIQFSGSGFTSFASILAATTTGASGAVITVSPGNTVTLFGVSVASLSADDFLI